MADDNQELRHVNWTELFSFTQIFKGFRLAIHPSKMVLALSAIVLILVIGAVLDRVWSLAGQRAKPQDVYSYYVSAGEVIYHKQLDTDLANRQENLAQWYRDSVTDVATLTPVLNQLRREASGADSLFIPAFIEANTSATAGQKLPAPAGDVNQQVREDMGNVWNRYQDNVEDMLKNAGDRADAARKTVDERIEKDKGGEKTTEGKAAQARLESDLAALDRALWTIRRDYIEDRHRQVFGRGVGAALWQYEDECFDNAIRAVWRGNLFSGFDRLIQERGQSAVAFAERPQALPFNASTDSPEGMGFFAWAVLMLWGLIWLAFTHPLYALVFLLACLAVWAVLGGAIARIAALHAAREEKISIPQALRFSLGKFFSFFTAPLIPLAIILALGLFMGLMGLLMAVPIVDIVLSVLSGLGLILGAVIAFLTVGLLAGHLLMYPTIAVEGSDSFDAISRSFSYVFSRPWRYGLYTVVAVVYGTICYLFVRLFALLLLGATRLFVGHGFFGGGLSWNDAPQLGEGASKLDLLWAPPSFFDLVRPVNFAAMGGIESVAALFVNLWVCLVAGLVIAFAVSYAVSAFTTIYYLLRRKVDATDLDDVYVEEAEAEEEIPPATPPTEETTEGETPPEQPPATPPADQPPPDQPPAPSA